MRGMWISPSILTWKRVVPSWSHEHAGREQRSYAHWAHADRLTRLGHGEFHRRDVVSALKRAVDFRVQLLHEIWRFADIQLDLPRRSFERLEYLGVVRPRMLMKLIALRNAIEHEDMDAPPLEECLDLVDFVWYFLRSTDLLVIRTVDSLELSAPENAHGAMGTLRGGPQTNWNFVLDIRVDPALVSLEPQADWIVLQKLDNPLVYILPDDIINRANQVFPNFQRNTVDKDTGHYHACGMIVGSASHIRQAIGLMLTAY